MLPLKNFLAMWAVCHCCERARKNYKKNCSFWRSNQRKQIAETLKEKLRDARGKRERCLKGTQSSASRWDIGLGATSPMGSS